MGWRDYHERKIERRNKLISASRNGRMLNNQEYKMSEKRILPVFLLCFLFGVFGAHRFFVGKYGTAVLQLLTIGGLGIWTTIDLIIIIVGAFTDSEGKKITQWT